MDIKLHKPHDKFVREVLSDTANAVDFFRSALPAELVAVLDIDKLNVEPGSLIEEKFREYYTDNVYKFPMKTSGRYLYVYLLFEHKIEADEDIYLQLLKYMAELYLKYRAPVVPYVFYHGEQEWWLPLQFSEFFKLNEEEKFLTKYMPDFTYELFDPVHHDLNGLVFDLTIRAFLHLLRYSRDESGEFEKRLIELIDLLVELVHSGGDIKFIQKLMLYLGGTKDLDVIDRTRELFRERLTAEQEAEMMTAIESLVLKAKLEDARNFLANGVSLEIVIKSTGLTREQLIAAGIEIPPEER